MCSFKYTCVINKIEKIYNNKILNNFKLKKKIIENYKYFKKELKINILLSYYEMNDNYDPSFLLIE